MNYFLGLVICKLFASERLNTPWLLHLDVFRTELNTVLTGRSRPDLVGEMEGGGWIALECKGRLSAPNADVQQKAKKQACRVVSVNGSTPAFRIGGIAFFQKGTLRFYWEDPEPAPVKNPIVVKLHPDDWRHYYAPVVDLIRTRGDAYRRMLEHPTLVTIEEADVQVGIRPQVLSALDHGHWDDARHIAAAEGQVQELAMRPSIESAIPYRADGIAVVAGDSWSRRFEEPV